MRRLLRRLSVRSRLTLTAGAGALLVLTVASVLFYAGLSSSLSDAVTGELRVRADDVAAELEAGVPPVLGRGHPTQVVADGRVMHPAGEAPFLDQPTLEAAESDEVVVDGTVPGVGAHARVVGRPARLEDGSVVVVVVAGSTAPVVRARELVALILVVGGPVMVVAVAVLAWWVTGAALGPVRKMSRRAENLSLVDTNERLPVAPGNDEIAELGHTLNRMLGRIAATVAHERAFVDDASHELRTPLAVLRGELELARADLERDAPEGVAAVESALEETDRLITLTNQLLALARADADHVDDRSPVDLHQLAVEVVSRIEPTGRQVEVVGSRAVVDADPSALARVVDNLVANALRWSSRRVRVKVTARRSWALLQVADDGPGFDPELGERALDRFARAGSARNRADGGTGLGLAIVASIVRSHRGTVTVGSGRPLGGARVDVRLPLVTE